MKKFPLIFILLGLLLLYSCKSKEDKAKDIVDNFIKQINDKKIKIEDIDFTKVSDDYKELFLRINDFYYSENRVLSLESDSDSSIIVKSMGTNINSLGQPDKICQEFTLKKRKNGDWEITNSYNVLALFLDFEIVDHQWEFYWDKQKTNILKELQEKLELKVLVPGYREYFSEYVKGKLKLINNSDYDIKGVNILIEHYDSEGKSVNTDNASVYDIIRKHGYREFDWLTGDCSKCTKQEFKINFIRESD